MKYYIIAGEASGDLHGSNLIRALKKKDPAAIIRCWGGDLMEAQGATLVKHYRDLAFMGFTEVVKHLGTIFRNLSFCKKDIEAFNPDAIIFIDYPGFNLRIAGWAKEKKYKTIYYISPQAWAWKEKRVHQIKAHIDLMLVILPFETAFYQKWDYEAFYVGHPLIEVIQPIKEGLSPTAALPFQIEKPIIALLPGSRKQEISQKLPIMLEMSHRYPDFQFVVAMAPGLDPQFYAAMLEPYPQVKSTSGHTYGLLTKSRAALVTSGTATLETALFGVPEIVCYKSSQISYQIAKRIIRVPYISLVNLIMDREIVRELIQHDLNPNTLTQALDQILFDTHHVSKLENDYKALWDKLSQGGHASDNAAHKIMGFLTNPASKTV
jgi:lipid-A-disaccharide synthase